MFFTTLQESLRIQEVSILGIMIKTGILPLNLWHLVGMNFYARKWHTLRVSFVAARLGSSVVESSRPPRP